MFSIIFMFLIKWKLLNEWIIIAPFIIDIAIVFCIIDTIHYICKYKYKTISFDHISKKIESNKDNKDE